jgi:OPT family oligopeptide transporter
VLAVALAFVLSAVASRTTGETDLTPMGAMGKIAQLTFGVLAPANIVTNLMTAGVTANAAAGSADLLTDLKSGYLLGANPRKQFLAQLIGILAGTIVIVPVFNLLVPDVSVIGGERFPVPSAQVWAAVAKLLANGLSALPPSAHIAIIIAGAIGIILTLLEQVYPEKTRFIPSALGLGVAMVIPANNSISIFIGGLAAYFFKKRAPQKAGTYTLPIASGIIAGESLIGVLLALLAVSRIL